MGRQGPPRDRLMVVMATPEWRAAVRALAGACGLSMADLVRLALARVAAERGVSLPSGGPRLRSPLL